MLGSIALALACLDGAPAGDGAYVLSTGGTQAVCGTPEDLRAAERALEGGGDGLWIRSGGSEWLLRDPLDVRDAAASLAPRTEVERLLRSIAGKQAVLGEEQTAILDELGRLRDKKAGYERHIDAPGAAEKLVIVSERIDELANRLSRLDARQIQLTARNQELVVQLERAAADARQGLSVLLDRALRHGAAIRR